jgi:hypothetical protein
MSDAYVPKQSVDDREFRKFKPDENGDVAVNVVSDKIEGLLEDIADNTGGASSASQDTLQFEGSVGTTPIDLPGVAGGEITQVIFSCRVQAPSSRRLLFSVDGGSTFFTLSPGSMVGWEPKDIEQVQIKGNVAGVLYDVLINRRTP